MVTLKLDDLEVASLITACNTAANYYDDLLTSNIAFAKEVHNDFIEAKKNYESLAKKLGRALFREDEGLC